MININFYMKAAQIKKELMQGKKMGKQYIFDKFEVFRSKKPM